MTKMSSFEKKNWRCFLKIGIGSKHRLLGLCLLQGEKLPRQSCRSNFFTLGKLPFLYGKLDAHQPTPPPPACQKEKEKKK